MQTYLQNQIETRRKERKLSIHKLEMQAGVKRGAIRNIILGTSKNPGIDLLTKIAKTLECTVNDLIDLSNSTPASSRSIYVKDSEYEWNESLYIDCVKAISKNLNEKIPTLKLEQVLTLTSEAYKYSIDKQADKADQDFIKWLVNRNC
jgi:transcriptional regulator with XRE-family HTH domain